MFSALITAITIFLMPTAHTAPSPRLLALPPGIAEDTAGDVCVANGGTLTDDPVHRFVCILP